MLLTELKASKKAQPTFVGLYLDEESKKAVVKLKKAVPNPIADDDIHITLIYSRDPIIFKPRGKLDKPIKIKPKKYSLFDTEEGQVCLVLEIDSQEVVDRHKLIMDVYGASYDHPKYNPHISLSYDVGKDFDLSSLPKIDSIPELNGITEYAEKLDLNWVSNSEKDKD